MEQAKAGQDKDADILKTHLVVHHMIHWEQLDRLCFLNYVLKLCTYVQSPNARSFSAESILLVDSKDAKT